MIYRYMSKVLLSDGIACENTADPYKTQLASASNRKCEAGCLKLPILTVELWMELFSPNLEIFQQKSLEVESTPSGTNLCSDLWHFEALNSGLTPEEPRLQIYAHRKDFEFWNVFGSLPA